LGKSNTQVREEEKREKKHNRVILLFDFKTFGKQNPVNCLAFFSTIGFYFIFSQP
jgi:hypothetical protein